MLLMYLLTYQAGNLMVKSTDENVNDVAVSEPPTVDENGVADLPF